MKQIATIILFILSLRADAQIAAYKAQDVMNRVSNTDTFYVVNFWATWCGPCIKELPEFTKISKQFAGKPVKILLVSLDFKEAYPKKIAAFVQKKKLEHEVVWLNETNANDFIPKIDDRWQGSIPATLLYYKHNEYTNFFEGMVTASQLQLLIEKQLALQ
ncbi:hypothetical protein CAP35_00410 [Chitinophagaceae bacterium IBVUCB1]|nr:hypothetical protein CAP35_00410 [Chitinophagaceae bacterium IBVUCB1]